MKHTLPFFLFLFFTSHTFAQDAKLVIDPVTVEDTYSGDLSNPNLDIELHATVKNVSPDSLSLRWERIILDQPTEWLTQVCDNNFCYEAPISTNFDLEKGINEPVILAPDSSFVLIFHVLPKTQAGIGRFELPFSLIEEPTEILEKVTFIANVGEVTSVNDFRNRRITAYPNPTIDYFQLSSHQGINKIVIYSMLGKRVKTFDQIFAGKKYDVIDLPNGLYLISLMNDNEGVVKTLRLSKRVFRP